MRKVYQADAIEWLPDNKGLGAIITSLPDAHEINMTAKEWEPWFGNAALLCLEATKSGTPCIFCQTDRKAESRTFSKAHLILDAAEQAHMPLIWHKIALRQEPGKLNLYRPSFSHIMAFGNSPIGKPTPDVIQVSQVLWEYGMTMEATVLCVGFALRFTKTIVDPFCGEGTVLAIADSMGAENTIGVEIDEGRATRAGQIQIGKGAGPYVQEAF